MSITKHPFKPGDREEWLTLRESLNKQIGGSRLGAIANHSKYSSFLKEFEIELGVRPKPDLSKNISVRLGHFNEPLCAEMFSEVSGKKVREEFCIFTNDKAPHLKASVDRLVEGENSGLECKTSFGRMMDSYKPGEFPLSYRDQCIVYLIVTEADRWYLAMLQGNDFKVFLLTRVKAEAERYAELKAKFGFKADPEDPDYGEWVAKWSWLEAVEFVSDRDLEGTEIIAANFIEKVETANKLIAAETFENEKERNAHIANVIYQVLDPDEIPGLEQVGDILQDLAPAKEEIAETSVKLSTESEQYRKVIGLLHERDGHEAAAAKAKSAIDEIDGKLAMEFIKFETVFVPPDEQTQYGWKIQYKYSTPRRTASIPNLEKYFATLGQPVPEGLIGVSKSNRNLSVSLDIPKAAKKGKAKSKLVNAA